MCRVVLKSMGFKLKECHKQSASHSVGACVRWPGHILSNNGGRVTGSFRLGLMDVVCTRLPLGHCWLIWSGLTMLPYNLFPLSLCLASPPPLPPPHLGQGTSLQRKVIFWGGVSEPLCVSLQVTGWSSVRRCSPQHRCSTACPRHWAVSLTGKRCPAWTAHPWRPPRRTR